MLGNFLGSEDPVESLIEQTNTATKCLLSSGTLVIRGKENPHGMRRGNKILVECGPLLSCIFLILLDRSHCLCLFICLNKLYFGIILDWTRLQQLYRISVYILPCSLTLTSFITTVHLAKAKKPTLLHIINIWVSLIFPLMLSFCPKIQFRVPHSS